jgi:hypothetical protein
MQSIVVFFHFKEKIILVKFDGPYDAVIYNIYAR